MKDVIKVVLSYVGCMHLVDVKMLYLFVNTKFTNGIVMRRENYGSLQIYFK